VKKGLETAPPQHDRVHRPLRRNSNQVFFEVPNWILVVVAILVIWIIYSFIYY
jgi:hypothetical protein